jgi:hypothetical protein
VGSIPDKTALTPGGRRHDDEGWCLDSGELIRGDGSDHERLAIVSVLYWLYPIGW